MRYSLAQRDQQTILKQHFFFKQPYTKITYELYHFFNINKNNDDARRYKITQY